MTGYSLEHDSEPYSRGTTPGLVILLTALGGLALLGALTSGATKQYLDIPSIALVVGGTIGATLLHYSRSELAHCYRSLVQCLARSAPSPYERIQLLVDLAHTAREHGLLALENAALRTDDPFLRTGLQLAADGDRMHDLRPLLENELYRVGEQMEHAASVLYAMAGYAPAMGLIGTLIGLIQMLSSLNNPTLIGPSMSLALVSTLYGSLASNLLFLPLAGKIRSRTEHESLVRRVTLEGVVGLAALESPTLIAQRLRSFVAGAPYDG